MIQKLVQFWILFAGDAYFCCHES